MNLYLGQLLVTIAFLNYDKKKDQVGEMMEHLFHIQEVQRIAPHVLNSCSLTQYDSRLLHLKRRNVVWRMDYACIAAKKATT